MQRQNESASLERSPLPAAIRKAAESTSLERRSEAKSLLLCLTVVVAAMLLIWPAGDIAFGDDVAYSHVALRLSQTGHLIFNGWEAAMMLVHAYWGALVIKLFGFSLAHMRLSTVPFALACVALCYLISRRAGLNSSAAIFVAQLLGLSPIFLPYTVSYMTDVPGLFFFLLALFALIRASETFAGWKAYLWLAIGTGAGLLGGTGRQVVWFVPLVVLPYLIWVRRQEVRFAATCAGAWCLSLLSIAAIASWFNHQPYAVPMPTMFSEFRMALARPAKEAELIARALLMLLWMCLPAAVPFVFRSAADTWKGEWGRKILVGALLLGVACAVLIHPSLASIPWMPSTLNWEGINGDAPLPGLPVVLTRPIRAVVALTVYAAACILAGELLQIRELARRAWRALISPSPTEFALAAMLLVSVAYFVAMMIRAIEFDPFDRYLLPLMPCVSTALLLQSAAGNPDAERIRPRVMPLAWGILLITGAYAILSTHDYWSLARARVTATRRLEAAGIPRTAIDAGMEYNFWTQLLVNGHLNWHWVKNPPDAFRPGFGHTPEVIPSYLLEYAPVPTVTVPTEFGSVPYFSVFPPFRKKVCIDRILAR